MYEVNEKFKHFTGDTLRYYRHVCNDTPEQRDAILKRRVSRAFYNADKFPSEGTRKHLHAWLSVATCWWV